MTEININDKVRINFRRHANLKGMTGTTNFIIGTVIDKTTIDHSGVNNPAEYSTYYKVRFDEEYFLEYSNAIKASPLFPSRKKKFMTSLQLQCGPNIQYADDYLCLTSMVLV
jgi:hypothetical protein